MTAASRQERQIACEAVRSATAVCRSVQAQITQDVLEKKDRSPVTVADFSSQALICRAIREAFPDDPIIAEEDSTELRQSENSGFLDRVIEELATQGVTTGGNQVFEWIDQGGAREFSERFWTLDPIDGTKGFLRGEQYAVSLALIVNGCIDVAVLGCPNLVVNPKTDHRQGALFVAIRAEGAAVMPLDGEPVETAIGVSTTEELNQARFCESVESEHSAHGRSAEIAQQLGIVQDPVRLDSQAKYAVVARGEADIYLRLPTRADYREKIWDHAGGVLIVEEAGGRVTDIGGKPLDFTHGRELRTNRGVIVTNHRLHERVLTAL